MSDHFHFDFAFDPGWSTPSLAFGAGTAALPSLDNELNSSLSDDLLSRLQWQSEPPGQQTNNSGPLLDLSLPIPSSFHLPISPLAHAALSERRVQGFVIDLDHHTEPSGSTKPNTRNKRQLRPGSDPRNHTQRRFDEVKDKIGELYMGEWNLALKDVIPLMDEMHGFKATSRNQ